MTAKLRAILLTAAVIKLLSVAPALAASCEAYCDPTIGCSGGCAISQDGCSVICIEDPCDTECYSAPRTCGGGGRTYCPQRPIANSPAGDQRSSRELSRSGAALLRSHPEPPEPGWALLRYELRSDVPVDGEKVTAVRASSDAFAQFAKVTVARLENEDGARLRQTSDPHDRGRLALFAGPKESLFVAPRACDRPRVTLKSRRLAGRLPGVSRTVYFRGTTDGTGRIASLDVLFSEAPEPEVRSIVGFGEANLEIRSQQHPDLPLEVFGSLTLRPDGRVGYEIAAAGSLF